MERPLAPPENFVSEVGKGVRCTVGGRRVHLGNRRCLTGNDIRVRPGTFDAMEFLENEGQVSWCSRR